MPDSSTLGTPQHAEVDDRAVQFGVLDRSKCFDDLIVGHVVMATILATATSNLHYDGR